MSEAKPKSTLADVWESQTFGMPVAPQCHTCKHWFKNTLSCAAFFPIQIPDEILDNTFNHTEEYLGDEGILYEAGEPISPAAP